MKDYISWNGQELISLESVWSWFVGVTEVLDFHAVSLFFLMVIPNICMFRESFEEPKLKTLGWPPKDKDLLYYIYYILYSAASIQ